VPDRVEGSRSDFGVQEGSEGTSPPGEGSSRTGGSRNAVRTTMTCAKSMRITMDIPAFADQFLSKDTNHVRSPSPSRTLPEMVWDR
jgi:hypothetical protein